MANEEINMDYKKRRKKELKQLLFDLANEFSLIKEGEISVRLHTIHNHIKE